jgi:hypothetical protein
MGSRRYIFTLNNPTEESMDLILTLQAQDFVKYLVYGREHAPVTGTPHLQGFIIFARPQRCGAVRSYLPGAHIEPALGTSQQCRDYCIKDGDFVEFGEFPSNPGQRNDIASVVAWADNYQTVNGVAAESPDIAIEQPVAYIRFPRLARALFHRAPAPTLQEGELRPWQRDLVVELETEADDRSIIFYVDEEGNKGKSWLCRYLVTKFPRKVQLMSSGKVTDMAYAVDTRKSIFLFNIQRAQMEFFQYSILEMLKDRVVFSSKYQSVTKLFGHLNHVIVFCNEMPDMSKMSVDRYIIRNL